MERHFNFLPPYITMLQYLDIGTLYGEFVKPLQLSVRQPFKRGTIVDHNRSFHYTVTAMKNTIYLGHLNIARMIHYHPWDGAG